MEIFEFDPVVAGDVKFLRVLETDYIPRCYVENADGKIIADTQDAQSWNVFYDLGWSKDELHNGVLHEWENEYAEVICSMEADLGIDDDDFDDDLELF